MDRPKKLGYWWAFGLGCVIILAFYGRFVFSPNNYLFSEGGDGLKNYYTFAWHINYDSSYTHFRGMNYPYGEHVVFTDNQPLISNIARFVHLNITPVGHYAIGINNLLLFVGLLITVLVLYKLLFALTHNPRIAVAGAIVLAMLSPQINRFNGHFALAYCFVIPLFIWWMYKFFHQPNWRTSRAMGIMMLLLLFVHVYYLVIIGALLLSMWLVILISESPRINIFTAIPHLFIQLALPFVVYFIWLKVTDNVADRPTQPYGIVEYAAYWEGLLLPLDFEYFKPLKAALGVRKVSVETIAYAGFPALLFILWGIISGIRGIFRRRKRVIVPTNKIIETPYNQRFMVALLWAVCIVFVYAAFVPYLFNIPAISKYLGLLKQFRSLGRLLWVVFYGLNIFIIWYVYQKTRHKIKLVWVPYALLLVFAVEGTIFNIHNSALINNPYEVNKWTPNKVNANNYKSIIPLPFFHEGSENIGTTPSNDKIVEQSLLLSMQTGIPLNAVKMSRTSLSETLQQLEMGYEYAQIPRPMLGGVKKPFLLLQYISDSTTLPELTEMQPIATTDSFRLYRFSPKILEIVLLKRATTIDREAQAQLNSLYFFNGFEGLKAEKVYTGTGALAKSAGETITLADTTCVYCGDSLSVSFWIYAHMEGLPQLKLLVKEGKQTTRIHIPNHVKAFNNDWMLVEYTYQPKSKKLHLQLIKEGAAKGQTIFIDNLLIRAAQYDVLQRTPDFAAKNNRYYSLNNP